MPANRRRRLSETDGVDADPKGIAGAAGKDEEKRTGDTGEAECRGEILPVARTVDCSCVVPETTEGVAESAAIGALLA